MSQMTPMKTIRTTLFQLFSDNVAGILNFLILQDRHNIRTLSLNIQLICTRCETGYKRIIKCSLVYLFLKLVQTILYFPTMYGYCICSTKSVGNISLSQLNPVFSNMFKSTYIYIITAVMKNNIKYQWKRYY